MSQKLEANHICVIVIYSKQSDDSLTDGNGTHLWNPQSCVTV